VSDSVWRESFGAIPAPVIRAGTLDDAPGIARLINAVIAEETPVLLTGAFADDEERAFLAALAPRGGFHVAEAATDPAATRPRAAPPREIVAAQVFAPYAADMPAHAHVVEMGTWVDAAWRRRGLGRSLWEQTAALARERGFTKVFTDVRADNLESLAFHLAIGFSIVGTARGQAVIDGRVHDVVLIERGL
jgi:L-amino acid N-acyltransferase YncA